MPPEAIITEANVQKKSLSYSGLLLGSVFSLLSYTIVFSPAPALNIGPWHLSGVSVLLQTLAWALHKIPLLPIVPPLRLYLLLQGPSVLLHYHLMPLCPTCKAILINYCPGAIDVTKWLFTPLYPLVGFPPITGIFSFTLLYFTF